MSGSDSDGFEIQLNPSGMTSEYLAGLNRCFHGWGGMETYRWAFERSVGGPPADQMVLRIDGRLRAGSAVSYRRVALASGAAVDAGVMTGSWTLPEVRGRGAFTRMIDESVRLASGRGAGLLLAFVTSDNPSARRLASAGSARFPTFYLFSTEDTPVPRSAVALHPVRDPDEVARHVMTVRAEEQAGSTHFHYPDREVWISQFLQRPGQIEVLSVDDSSWAVVESAGSTDRVHLLVIDPGTGLSVGDCIATLLRRALARNRSLFLFSTVPETREESLRLGLSVKPGYLTALVADEAALREALSAPRSEVTTDALGDPASPWFLGDWDLQSGDRA